MSALDRYLVLLVQTAGASLSCLEITRRRSIGALLSLAVAPYTFVRPLSQTAHAATAPFVVEVAKGIFVHQGRHALFAPDNEGDISNAGFIVGNQAVAVIDTSGSVIIGQRLHDAIRAVTGRPIRYVINTHMHPDHVFGNAAFASEGTEFVAHHKMGRGLAARAEHYLARNKELLGDAAFAGIKIVMPTRPVEGTIELDLGGRILKLEAQPTAHTDNDLIVEDTATGTLFLGDLLFVDHVPTLDGSIRGWSALMERLSQRPEARVVPGHGPPAVTWPDGAKPLRHYLDQLAADIRTLIKSGKTLSDAMASAGQSEKGTWLLFDDYNARNASAAFAELEWE